MPKEYKLIKEGREWHNRDKEPNVKSPGRACFSKNTFKYENLALGCSIYLNFARPIFHLKLHAD